MLAVRLAVRALVGRDVDLGDAVAKLPRHRVLGQRPPGLRERDEVVHRELLIAEAQHHEAMERLFHERAITVGEGLCKIETYHLGAHDGAERVDSDGAHP